MTFWNQFPMQFASKEFFGLGLGLALALVGCGGASKADGSKDGPKGGPGPVNVTFKTPEGAVLSTPPSLAYQDGEGAWKVATPSGGTYSLNITDPAGRYGFAILPDTGAYYSVTTAITLSSRAEYSDIQYTWGAWETGTSNVEGQVSGLASPSTGRVTLARAGATVTMPVGATYPRYLFSNLANKPFDFALTIHPRGTGTTSNDTYASGVFLQRNLRVDLESDGYLEMGSVSATTPPELLPLNIQGLAGETDLRVSSTVWTSGSAYVQLASFAPFSGNQYPALPGALRQAGDLHQVIGYARTMSGSSWTSRSAGVYLSTPAAQTLSLTPGGAKSTVSLTAKFPYVRMQAKGPIMPGASYYYARFRQVKSGGIYINWYATITPGRAGSGAEVTYTLPDMSGLPGWNPIWGMEVSSAVSWSAGYAVRNWPLFTPAADGNRVGVAENGGRFDPSTGSDLPLTGKEEDRPLSIPGESGGVLIEQ